MNPLLFVRIALVLVGCALVALGAVGPKPAAAAESTIRSATIKVGAETFTIDVVVNSLYSQRIVEPIKVVVTLPKGTAGTVIATDQGFNGRGWSISFRQGTSLDSGVVAVTVRARKAPLATAVGLASNFGWAVEVPSRTNQPALIQFFTGTLPTG